MSSSNTCSVPAKYPWATNAWALGQFVKFLWMMPYARTLQDIRNLRQDRTAYIEKYYLPHQLADKAKAFEKK